MKKIMSVFLACCLLIGSCLPAFAAEGNFSDVTDAEKLVVVQKLVDAGVIKGYEDGTFRPNAPVLRSELSRMINQVFAFANKASNTFSDVDESQWFYGEICIAKNAGYISGFEDGTFRPNAYVTREQACVILDKIMQFDMPENTANISDTVSSWAQAAVQKVVSANIMPLENGAFRATQNITRMELCEALVKFVADNSDVSAAITDRADAVKRLTEVSSILETKVIPLLSTNKQTQMVKLVVDNMKAYVADENYDIAPSVKKAAALYATMSETEKNELQQLVLLYVPTNDLLALKDFFVS